MTILALLLFAVIIEVASRWVFPRIHGTDENLAAIASAREILDRELPIHHADRQISETVYNHGGSLGVARRYASALSNREVMRKFAALQSDAVPPVDARVAARDGSVVYCFGAFQLSLSQVPDGGYEAFAVRDDTAVEPAGCMK